MSIPKNDLNINTFLPLGPSENLFDLAGLKLSAPEERNFERKYFPLGVMEGVIG